MPSLEVKLRKAVLAATDGKLRSDNWQYIIGVCDLVKEDPEDASQIVMEMIEKRLGQNDANVMLRSLALVVALAENCGSRLKQQVSSKHFTGILAQLLESGDVHMTVKKEIAKVVKQLSDSFKSDPSLKTMGDLNTRIRRKWPGLLEEPEKPSKQKVSHQEATDEDQELQRALKMSLEEFEKSKQQSNGNAVQSNSLQDRNQGQQQPQQPTTSGIRRVRALYDLNANEQDELSFRKGDVIVVLEQVYRDWWRGSLHGKIGIFPLNYVTPITEPSPVESQREQQIEESVLSQAQNVQVLSAKMQMASGKGLSELNQDPEFNDLYSTVTPIRPHVTKLIGKYAKEKDDVIALRQVLLNAESTYNELLDRAAKSYSIPNTQAPPYAPAVTSQPGYVSNNTYQTTNGQYTQHNITPQQQYQVPSQNYQSQPPSMQSNHYIGYQHPGINDQPPPNY